MKLISVIIPSYNAAQYIGQTIKSVINQTYTNWELLIIDDGSKDTTKEIVQTFLGDSRIQYIYQNNAGVSAARNHGISIAKGEFLAFLDADDVWYPENLEIKLKELDNINHDFVYGDIVLTDENLNVTKKGEKGTDNDIMNKILLWEGEVIPCPSGNLLVRKKCFANGLKFDTRFSTAADQDFIIWLSKDFNGKYIEHPCVMYRVLPGSMSKNIPVMEKDHIGVYEKAKAHQLFKGFWFRQRCYSNLYFILAGSYWVNAGNKWRGFYFVLKSILIYPPSIKKIFKRK